MTDKAQSDKEKVLAVWPCAVAYYREAHKWWTIYEGKGSDNILGRSGSLDAAWSDAASCLPSSPQQEEPAVCATFRGGYCSLREPCPVCQKVNAEEEAPSQQPPQEQCPECESDKRWLRDEVTDGSCRERQLKSALRSLAEKEEALSIVKSSRESLWEQHQKDVDALAEKEAEIARLKQQLDEETKTVSRIWKALGLTTYASAGGKEISEIVRELKAELAVTRKALEMVIAEFYHYETGRARALKRALEAAKESR